MRSLMRLRIGAAAAAAGLLAVLGLASAPAAEDAHPSAIRIGLVKTLFRDMPELLIPIALQPMKALMEGQTGLSGDLVPSGDADHLAHQIKNDDLQLGVFHGVEFAWVHANYPTLKPLVIAVNEHPYLRALLVVRTEGKIGAAANLQGKAVALPRMSREHCRLFLERRCCPPGEAPEAFFGEYNQTGDVDDALDDVVDDRFQAAVVDEVAFEAYRKNKPGRCARLKVLQQSESFPCAVIAYQPGALTEQQLQAFRNGLLKAKDNPDALPLLRVNHITGFESVPSDYNQELVDILKAYPPAAAK